MIKDTRVCPKCSLPNSTTNETCVACGTALNSAEYPLMMDPSISLPKITGLMIWWAVANGVGFAVGLFIGWMLFPDNSAYQFLIWFIIGGSVGFMQWVVLRSRIRRADWWILATILGVSLGWAIAEIIVKNIMETRATDQDLFLAWLIIWGVVGAIQWFILRHQFRQAWLWIPATAIGGLLVMVSTGLLFGVLTALVLNILIEHPISANEEIADSRLE